MSARHLRRQPHRLKSGHWWYEEVDGIYVYSRAERTTQLVKISWHALRQALKRKDRKP